MHRTRIVVIRPRKRKISISRRSMHAAPLQSLGMLGALDLLTSTRARATARVSSFGVIREAARAVRPCKRSSPKPSVALELRRAG